MLYRLLHVWVNWCCLLFFRKVWVKHAEVVPESGPVLLVANHPNSFMDAVLIALSTNRPIHFLARGDAFNNRILNRIFRSLYMLPVYRASEGVGNIAKNQETFDAVHAALAQGGVVLIFGEGLCEHNWRLRPQKKGAARITERAWSTQNTAALKVIPVGLTYEHFNGGGKSALVCFGKPITKGHWTGAFVGAAFVKEFNAAIAQQIKQLAYFNAEMTPNDSQHHQMRRLWHQIETQGADVLAGIQNSNFHTTQAIASYNPVSRLQYSIIGLPHYFLMQTIARRTTKDSVFYDSVFFGLTVLLLPAYVITIMYVLLLIFV